MEFETINPAPNNPTPRPATLYDRQESLFPNAGDIGGVTIIGCGGVGTWVAMALAMAGVRDITLYDGDTLSIHNLNRLPYPTTKVGELKSLVLSDYLKELRPDGDFQPRGEFDLEYGNWVSYRNWVICATDNLKSRKAAYAKACEEGSGYIEVGADGNSWSLSPAPPEFSTEEENRPGYTVIPVHVGPCMMAGAAVVYYIMHGRRPWDSHHGDWDGQRLELATMREETFSTYTCGICGKYRVNVHHSYDMYEHLVNKHKMNEGEADRLSLSWVKVEVEDEDKAIPDVEEVGATTLLDENGVPDERGEDEPEI